MEAGKTVEYTVCPDCKADKALETQRRTAELNEKLKKIGVSGAE